jgi:hypothetical protein
MEIRDLIDQRMMKNPGGAAFHSSATAGAVHYTQCSQHSEQQGNAAAFDKNKMYCIKEYNFYDKNHIFSIPGQTPLPNLLAPAAKPLPFPSPNPWPIPAHPCPQFWPNTKKMRKKEPAKEAE